MSAEDARWGEVQRELGEISAGMKGIRSDIQEQNANSVEHRREIKGKLDVLTERTAALETAQKATAADVAEMQPVVDEMRTLKQRGIGFLGAVGLVATSVGILVGASWDALKNWFTGLFS